MLELIDQQISDANAGHPEDFDLWRNRTEVVLRQIGNERAIEVFRNERYSPSVWTSGMDTSGYRPAGVNRAIKTLESLKFDLQLSEESRTATKPVAKGALPDDVFIVHGHNTGVQQTVARYLQDLTGSKPTILSEQPNGGKVLLEKFEGAAAKAGFAVVLMTADDVGRKKADTDDQKRARQNVIFEMGFFFGSIGRERVAVLKERDVEEPGDVLGIVYTPIDTAGAWKMTLAREMNAVGIEVDWSALGK